MKTFSAKPADVVHDWFVLDATDKVLGRVACEVARRLRGKHKPEFTPHVDTGDFIVITNVEKLRVTGNKGMSEETMRKVDAEIRKIIDMQYALARKLIEENRDKIEAMTKALLEFETIDADQIKDIMEGRPPRAPKPSSIAFKPKRDGEDGNKPEPAKTEPAAAEGH